MLLGLDPVLSPDLLRALCAMGHGDRIVIADANFPAESCGRPVLRLEGVPAPRALEAVLSVMPLDRSDPNPAISMQMVGDPDAVPEVVARFQDVIEISADWPARIASLERFDFYTLARGAFVILQTGETRPYGNLMLTKGVVIQEQDF